VVTYTQSQGTWANTGSQTTKTDNGDSYQSFNATNAFALPLQHDCQVTNFDSFYLAGFFTQTALDAAWAADGDINEDNFQYGFRLRPNPDGGGAPAKIIAIINGVSSGGYSSDSMTSSSKIRIILTSSAFKIDYSIDGSFTDTVNFFTTSISSTGTWLVVTNNNAVSFSNSITINGETPTGTKLPPPPISVRF